jgi:hypothetical protein
MPSIITDGFGALLPTHGLGVEDYVPIPPVGRLAIVNTVPGLVMDPVSPGGKIYFGLRAISGVLQPALTRADIGYSSIQKVTGRLPEADSDAVLQTPEHLVPPNGQAVCTTVDGLTITKSNSSFFEKSVYEISSTTGSAAGSSAYVKLKKSGSWTARSVDWCGYSPIASPYIGLVHGGLNTGLYAFFRDSGIGGSLVIGGPLQNIGEARTGELELPFSWKGLPEGTSIELWLYLSYYGAAGPLAPVSEVWARVNEVGGPDMLSQRPAALLGTFRGTSTGFVNSKDPSNTCQLLIGNCGAAGDVVTYSDWALFPDYRSAILNGVETPFHASEIRPECPSVYRPSDGKKPDYPQISRWIVAAPSYSTPAATLYTVPGAPDPSQLRLARTTYDCIAAYCREEARVGGTDGYAIEAFMGWEKSGASDTGTGAGISIEDGSRRYSLMAVDDNSKNTFGLAKTDDTDSLSAYHLPVTDINTTTLRMCQLVVDVHRNRVMVIVDGTKVLDLPKSSSDFPSSPNKFVSFGFLKKAKTLGTANFGLVNYLSRYLAWEGDDGVLPDSGGQPIAARFTRVVSGGGSTSGPTGGIITLTSDDARYFYHENDFGELTGTQVDFTARVVNYSNSGSGVAFPTQSKVGAGLKIHLGTKVLYLGFYDCGSQGRRIGIVPGSGSEDDIINATNLGQQFSARVDWTQPVQCRVTVRGYHSIEVTFGPPQNPPSIVIPWRGYRGFDLPQDAVESRISFGHFESDMTSTTEWSYVRWGLSSGYDYVVRQLYPEGPKRYLFGGRALIRIAGGVS